MSDPDSSRALIFLTSMSIASKLAPLMPKITYKQQQYQHWRYERTILNLAKYNSTQKIIRI
jgi:hypothetical protein